MTVDSRSDQLQLIPVRQRERRSLTSKNKRKSTITPTKRYQRCFSSHQVFQDWWLEVCSVLVTYGALVAIIIILGIYNRRPLPSWPDYLSLNSIVSIFTTVVRASLALVLGEGIGQLKWGWFQTTRPLKDIQTYDDASRGPLGSARLVILAPLKHRIASLGAVTTCLTILMGPFSQQVLKYYNCPQILPNNVDILPVAQNYNEYGVQGPPVGIKLAITAGLVNPDQYQPSFTCDTGNCTIPTIYHSWGFCSECDDYSDTVIVARGYLNNCSTCFSTITNTTLPSGLVLSWNSATSLGAGRLFETQAAVDGHWVAIQIGLSKGGSVPVGRSFGQFDGCPLEPISSDWRCRGYGGSQCWIQPCIKTFNGSVSSGQLKEIIIQETKDFAHGFVAIDPQCLTPDQLAATKSSGFSALSPQGLLTRTSEAKDIPTTVPKKCIYSMRSDTAEEINKYAAVSLSGYINNVGNVGDGSSEAIGTLYNSGRVSYEQITNYFGNLSSAVSKHIRQNGDISAITRVTGQASKNETCVQVRWVWLCYPVLMMVMTSIFFLLMVQQSSNHSSSNSLRVKAHSNSDPLRHNLKSDILSVLFHGFDQTTLQLLQDRKYGYSSDTADLSRDAKLQHMKLQMTEHGLKLVLDDRDTSSEHELRPVLPQLRRSISSTNESMIPRAANETLPGDRT